MRIEQLWQRHTLWPLLPFSGLFALLSGARRLMYRYGLLASYHLDVPVVVVGNITAGGAGKTPTVLHLAHALRTHGFTPGIISRGYGGKHAGSTAVPTDAEPAIYGDEPTLLAKRSGVPVWIGRDRVETARALISAHPDTDVILSDDGLQHYRLRRDIEIVVVDGERGFGNQWPLPAGPLREPVSRLQQADAVIVNGSAENSLALHPHQFLMRLVPGNTYPLGRPDECVPLSEFAGHPVVAIAGIAHPPRFFATLADAGLNVEGHAFPDHHQFTASDLTPFAGRNIMTTEKDAVKLAHLCGIDSVRIQVVPVDARVEPDLGDWLSHRLSP